MARLESFVAVGEAFKLYGAHEAASGRSIYKLVLLGGERWIGYDELVNAVKAIRADIEDYDMLSSEHWAEGDLISPLVRRIEEDWKDEAKVEEDEEDDEEDDD